MHRFNLAQLARLFKSSARGPVDDLALRGQWNLEHWRGDLLLARKVGPNGIVTQGKNYLLDAGFNGGTAIGTWYIGLLATTPVLAAADTYASHAGWTEFTAYTVGGSATRGEWAAGAAASGSITNGTPLVFDVTAGSSTPVAGICVVGGGTAATTKGDTAGGGTLWATALFGGGEVPVINGDQLKLTYTVNG